MTIEEKKQHVQPAHSKLSIQRQCELIGLPRSSYYREGLEGQEKPENLEIMKIPPLSGDEFLELVKKLTS